MTYDSSSIRILSQEEVEKHSPFGIASSLAAKHPNIEGSHLEKISQVLFTTGISPSLYERRYCSPVGTVAKDSLFNASELEELASLEMAFREYLRNPL